jgi:hypothetical protein
VDRDDGVLAIVLAAEHLLDLAGLDERARGRRGRGEVVGSTGSPASAHSTSTARSSSARSDSLSAILFEPAAALQHLLRGGLVLPEIGSATALDRVSSSAGRAASKIAPQIGGAARQVLVPAKLLV